MFCIPSRGRPHNLARFLAAYRKTEATSPLWIRLDADDPALDNYHTLDLPPGSVVHIGPHFDKRQCLSCTDEFFKLNPELSFYGLLGDDVIPRTPHWDRELIAAAGSDGLAYADDKLHGIKLATHPTIAGDLVRLVGWLTPEWVEHSFCDTAWMTIALRSNRLRYCDNVILEHMHPLANKALKDATYIYQNDYHHDQVAFWKWQGKDLRPLVDRIMERWPLAEPGEAA